MKSLKKSNRVSWPSDVNLCQVRLFLSDDCPSLVGMGGQEQLQMKTSWILHSNAMDSGDSPPGFMSSHKNLSKGEVPFSPKSNWKCPAKFLLSPSWQVAAGGESQEAGSQRQRELTVLEAVYPRPSTIPSSPSVSCMDDFHYDDRNTPVIPITPIEEDETVCQPSNLEASQYSNLVLNEHTSGETAGKAPSCFGADVITAASAALVALLKSSEPGSTIDTNLLIDILSNPQKIEKWIEANRALANTERAPCPALKPEIPKSSLSSATECVSGVQSGLANGSLNRITKTVQPTSTSLPIQQVVSLARSKSFCSPDIETGDKLHSQLNRMARPSSIGLPSAQLQVTSSTAPPAISTPKQVSFSISKPNRTSSARQAAGLPSPRLQAFFSNVPAAISTQKQVSSQDPFSTSKTNNRTLSAREATVNMSLPNVAPPSLGAMLSKQHHAPVLTTAIKPPTVVKDLNYCKNLIKQHGEERKDTQDGGSNMDSQARNGKQGRSHFEKPCIYFKTSRGCRNGSSCPYQHAMSYLGHASSLLEGQGTKRMKLR